MKLRRMSATMRLVTVAVSRLVRCSSFLCFGCAVAIELPGTPLRNPVGGVVSTDFHVGGNIHDPEHVDDVTVRRIKTDTSVLLTLSPIHLEEVLMLPILQGGLNGQTANLTLGLGSPDKVATNQIDDRGGRTSNDSSEKYESLWGGLDDSLIWGNWHGIPMLFWIIFGGCLGWSATYALWFGSIYLFRKVSSKSSTNAKAHPRGEEQA